jgi:hypothetical protein
VTAHLDYADKCFEILIPLKVSDLEPACRLKKSLPVAHLDYADERFCLIPRGEQKNRKRKIYFATEY